MRGPAGRQQFVTTPGWSHDVTPDGAVVVGWKPAGAWHWRWQLDPAPVVIGGLGALNAPFKQGVLVPQPDKLFFGLPLNGDGRLHLEFAWPGGIPSGLSLWFQAWIADAAAPAGLSSSNGLQSTAP